MRRRMIALAISLMALTSCSRTSVYVLDQAELVRVKSGQSVEARFDGWLLSDRAVDRVMNAKINGVKLK